MEMATLTRSFRPEESTCPHDSTVVHFSGWSGIEERFGVENIRERLVALADASDMER
jgi:hypothetical protein